MVINDNGLYLLILIQEWTSHDEEDKEANVWEDNWDDDNVEDDFSVQLRYVYIILYT